MVASGAQPGTDRQAVGGSPLRPSTSQSVPRKARSRLIKTNCEDDVKFDENRLVHAFRYWLECRDGISISIQGKLDGRGVCFEKEDTHRWTEAYFKKRRLPQLYRLKDWFSKLPESEKHISMVTLTVPHNENKWGKIVNSGHNIVQSWNNLKAGWDRIRGCEVFRDYEYVVIYEPHPYSGYPHIHMMVFHQYTDAEINRLKELWSDFTGADRENGSDVKPRDEVKSVISYIVKYMSKTLYHTRNVWTRAEWLFNSVAHAKRYRLFTASRNLSAIMKPPKCESTDSTIWESSSVVGLKPREEGDTVFSVRLWENTEVPRRKSVFPPAGVLASVADRVKAWMVKTGETYSPSEISFREDYARFQSGGSPLPRWVFRQARWDSTGRGNPS